MDLIIYIVLSWNPFFGHGGEHIGMNFKFITQTSAD